MRRFHCECGQPIFFENSVCLACGAGAGFLPARRDMLTLQETSPGIWQEDGEEETWKFCDNLNPCGCNWLLPAGSGKRLCESCDTTRVIPDLTSEKNQKRWHDIETAKRRLLLTLLDLGLWGAASPIRPVRPLTFDFKESLPGAPVMTGHENGVITLDIAEADDDRRELVRASLCEPYRTVLGHLRHEVGHYYWDVLVKDSRFLAEFRQMFGDDSADYSAALQHHYAAGPPANWAEQYVSAYATMHAWEDWAESWAHCLHMTDTMETADQSALSSRIKGPKHDSTEFTGIAGATQTNAADYAAQVERWCGIVILANELSRSMGQPDVYPFALSLPVLKKLFFIKRVIAASTTAP